jgi:hypothetical protein
VTMHDHHHGMMHHIMLAVHRMRWCRRAPPTDTQAMRKPMPQGTAPPRTPSTHKSPFCVRPHFAQSKGGIRQGATLRACVSCADRLRRSTTQHLERTAAVAPCKPLHLCTLARRSARTRLQQGNLQAYTHKAVANAAAAR